MSTPTSSRSRSPRQSGPSYCACATPSASVRSRTRSPSVDSLSLSSDTRGYDVSLGGSISPLRQSEGRAFVYPVGAARRRQVSFRLSAKVKIRVGFRWFPRINLREHFTEMPRIGCRVHRSIVFVGPHTFLVFGYSSPELPSSASLSLVKKSTVWRGDIAIFSLGLRNRLLRKPRASKKVMDYAVGMYKSGSIASAQTLITLPTRSLMSAPPNPASSVLAIGGRGTSRASRPDHESNRGTGPSRFRGLSPLPSHRTSRTHDDGYQSDYEGPSTSLNLQRRFRSRTPAWRRRLFDHEESSRESSPLAPVERGPQGSPSSQQESVTVNQDKGKGPEVEHAWYQGVDPLQEFASISLYGRIPRSRTAPPGDSVQRACSPSPPRPTPQGLSPDFGQPGEERADQGGVPQDATVAVADGGGGEMGSERDAALDDNAREAMTGVIETGTLTAEGTGGVASIAETVPRLVSLLDTLHEKVDKLASTVDQIQAPANQVQPSNRVSLTRDKRAKMYHLPIRRSAERNRFAADVRRHLDALLDRSLIPFPEEQRIIQYESLGGAQGRRCCSVYDFGIDLIRGPRSVWNKSAADVFVEDYAQTHQLQGEDNLETVREHFYNRVKSIKQLASPKRKQRDHFKVKRTRKYTTTLELEQLRGFSSLLQRLGPDGMSSDESEDEVDSAPGNRRIRPSYRVLTPRWRSDDLTELLHFIDSVHLMLRRMDPARQRGSWPRIRHHDPQRKIMSKSKRFVPGLPRNAYNEDFLGRYADNLELVKPTDVESLAFPVDILR
ncbi:hypothetical protein CC2G_013395 [Coprinopsis cinerea AmutBmut pab1-1]|nr:hypothetical protein CC2G_013395 [Coprinopsis cinerea AmutBmut pab1-1]